MIATRFVLSTLALSSAVLAQLSLPSQLYGLSFSAPCQQAILQVFSNGSFAQCVHATDLLPLVTSNSSIVPALDKFMTDVCYSAPCTNATLQEAATTILGGCSTDLANEGLSNSTVTVAFAQYALVREVLCLKTTNPYTNTSYGGVLGNPPIPISPSTYNSTDGYFCVTSLLTQLSAYFGTNLTLPAIEDTIAGRNATALGLAKSISPNIICTECVFAALDLIEEAYPVVGQVPLSTIFGLLNMTSPVNTTINGFVNGTCAYKPLAVSNNGTLPANITVSISNSTFPPFNVTTNVTA